MSETAGGCVYDGVPLDGVTVDLDARRADPARRPHAGVRVPAPRRLGSARPDDDEPGPGRAGDGRTDGPGTAATASTLLRARRSGPDRGTPVRRGPGGARRGGRVRGRPLPHRRPRPVARRAAGGARPGRRRDRHRRREGGARRRRARPRRAARGPRRLRGGRCRTPSGARSSSRPSCGSPRRRTRRSRTRVRAALGRAAVPRRIVAVRRDPPARDRQARSGGRRTPRERRRRRRSPGPVSPPTPIGRDHCPRIDPSGPIRCAAPHSSQPSHPRRLRTCGRCCPCWPPSPCWRRRSSPRPRPRTRLGAPR